jgi:hypothetical protein
MAEPSTVNVGLVVPNTGDLVGTWGSAALNPDFVALDGYFGGVQTVSLSNAPVTLTSPSGFTPTPGGGPTQAQNAVLRFTGTLSTNILVTLPLPGYMVIENLTTAGGNIVQFRAIGSGEIICVDQGDVQHIYNDGTNVRFVNLQPVNTYLDVAGTSIPVWISNCTKPPFLLCDGSTFNATTYPYLNQKLGGNTLPDFRGRNGYYVNAGTGRLTTGGAGIDGNTLFASANNNGVNLVANQIPALNGSNTITVSDASRNGTIITAAPGFAISGRQFGSSVAGDNNFGPIVGGSVWGGASSLSGTNSIIVNPSGVSASVPATTPGVVSGIRLIRAA